MSKRETKGFLLAGSRMQYQGFLKKHGLREVDWPYLANAEQLYGTRDEVIVVFGGAAKRPDYVHIKTKAINRGATFFTEEEFAKES